MKCDTTRPTKNKPLIIKKCHVCGKVNESHKEQERCQQCRKNFLPNQYFSKVHAKNSQEYRNLFSTAEELESEELVKGLNVIW